MPRSLCFQDPDAYDCVMACNRREAILCDDLDRRTFLGGLGQAWEQTGWRVDASALLEL